MKCKLFIAMVLLVSAGNTIDAEVKEYVLDTLSVPHAVYRHDPDLKIYFLYPEGLKKDGLRPAVVFFSGGGWIKSGPGAFAMQGKYLSEKGVVAVLADYRCKERHGTTPIECVQDAKSVMRYVKIHALEHHIDTARLVAAGGSAGGHLAAATAFVKGFDAPGDDLSVSPVPKALVLFNPVFNNAPHSEGGWGYARTKHVFPEFSPYHNVKPGAPPTLVMCGTDDDLVPVSTIEGFEEKMKAVGAKCETELYEGAGHAFFNFRSKYRPASGPSFYEQTLERMETFLKELGYIE